MGDLPLRTPTDRWLGGPLPRQQPNQTHPHPIAVNLWYNSDVLVIQHRVLIRFSPGYPLLWGRLDTRYSPVRRSPAICASTDPDAPRLACVKPVASVHPEPGSNSSLYKISLFHYWNVICPRTTIQIQELKRFVSHLPKSISALASCTTSVYVNLSKNSFFWCFRRSFPR